MNLDAIGAAAAQTDSVGTPIHKGRVLQDDADFHCYECCDLDETANENFQRLKKHIDYKRQMAGAEFVNVHITLGLKGGREQMASVQPYQEKRDNHRDPKIKERVAELRNMLANYKTPTTKPVVNLFQEADDSLAQFQLKQIKEHGVLSSVILSGDKDLWMVEGLHCDPKTGRMYRVAGYGKTEYREVGNVEPKLVGEGTSWFWHQMLIGDKADRIPGLPMISGRLAERYLPNKKPNPKRKALSCGEARAVAILNGVTTEVEAARRVLEAYTDHYGVEAHEMLLEQAFLLWMRRTPKILDVCTYLAEVGLPIKPTARQLARLDKYKALVKIQMEQCK